MLDFFNMDDTSDVPYYTNNKFKGGHRLRQAILFLIQTAKRPVTAKQLRVAFYRKYHECKGFQDLSVTQVSLLLRNLIIQKDIKSVSRGVYVINKDESKKTIITPVENQFKGMTMAEQILTVFPKRHRLNKSEVRSLIKTKLPHIQMSENSLASMLTYLKKRNFLHYIGNKYSLNLRVKHLTQMEKLSLKVNRAELDKMLNEQVTIIDIARHFHMSPQSMRKYLAHEGISRPLYKGTKLIDLKTGKIWYYIKDCLKELHITSAKLNAILKGDDTLEGHDIKRFKDLNSARSKKETKHAK